MLLPLMTDLLEDGFQVVNDVCVICILMNLSMQVSFFCICHFIGFIKKYSKSLNSLFTSLGADASFQVKDCSMITFFELL